MRDRAWLRSFLTLSARMDAMTVPEADILRQEDTVLRALSILEHQPGVVLADEVGMGKTYEALGVIAARHHEDPTRRALILTPGPDLNVKWKKELDAFVDPAVGMYRSFKGAFAEARTLRELLAVVSDPRNRIAIAPVSMFAGGKSGRDRAYLLSLFFHWRGLRGNQTAAALGRYRNGVMERVDVTKELFLDEVPWAQIEPIVDEVMRDRADKEGTLGNAFDAHGYELFESTDRVDTLLASIRYRIVRALIPNLDLLVVDEAHKLKNADSVRATAVREAFEKKFERALFLTATPFQLDVGELGQVLKLFALARGAGDDVVKQGSQLFADIRSYQAAYESFETSWRRLDGVAVADFARVFDADPKLANDVEDAGLRAVISHARRLFELKTSAVEPGFRKWMIRSLREDKREYRKHVRTVLTPSGGDSVPFLVYERFIAELFRTNSRTHKAAVQINMVSSYAAAREGALLSDELKQGLSPSAARYREMLRKVLDHLKDERGGHPKVAFVVDDALKAADRGEKTLIFCARTDTLQGLRQQIDEAWFERLVEKWQLVDPTATRETVFDVRDADERSTRGLHSKLRARFHRTQDALYLALRERYLQTALSIDSFGEDRIASIVVRANQALREQRVARSRAERFDWALAKRCIEHAAAIEWREAEMGDVDFADDLAVLANPDFLRWGFDLTADDLEPDEGGDHTPEWRISEEEARVLLAPSSHLWSYLKSTLHGMPRLVRVRAVEQLARYLTRQQVPFLAELMGAAKAAGLEPHEVHSREMLSFIDRFWTTNEGRPWTDLIRRFLSHFGKLDEARRRELLDGAVAAGEFVRHTRDGESRERLREAFNTPLFPMVLVANEVMQEGLDLHHQCARVVHHDLAWNPAQLEQRVGRVDRLGSLHHRKRAKNPAATLDVLHPLIARTIDVRLDRTVRAREKWLEFLLGAPPDFQEYGMADDPVHELPPRFADALRIDLGPRAGAGAE